ncbi:isocitrate lyase/phosphoenolpyruvate mutase family protein [Nocardia testacea]|uniref:Isocitrate lyase/phosphoenolpyruvate mutase family protein n=1 Tax=Nocardia testacea TaxID=248551 RepID=A0ABW7VWZ8_9NOCA
MTTLPEKAAAFLELHRPGDPVILPTVWDAWSANLVQQAGFPALTVGSHPLADSVGKSDHEGMAFTDVLGRVREITSAVDIPVSVDLESGYGVEPVALIDGLLQAGAVGFNLEDTVHKEGGRLREPQEHADLVGRLRQAADDTDVHVVVNARTDLLLTSSGGPAELVGPAVERLRLAAAAGADVLYPVGRYGPEVLRRLCAELPLPVNAVTLPEQGNKAYFAEAGAARVSFGPFLQAALAVEAKRLLEPWK